MIRIASWNVNSLRVRLEQVVEYLLSNKIDILCLQETKVIDDDFPLEVLEKAGYKCSFIGQKTYNGVAIISKNPPDEVLLSFSKKFEEEKRFILARYNNLTIVNLYVVNGQDPTSQKFQYKINWLNQVNKFIKKDLANAENYLIVGDFNIAPKDEDVYDPESWSGKILCTDKERELLSNLMQLGFKDCFRIFDQKPNLYSWWDYRTGAYRRNRGLRIDLMLANDKLAKACLTSEIDEKPRKNERPSDHAPVMSSFKI